MNFPEIYKTSISYTEYKKVAEFSNLNHAQFERMKFIDVNLQLPKEVMSDILNLNRKVICLVVVSLDSDDCAEILPILHKISVHSNGKFFLKLIMKNEGAELIEFYNTDGLLLTPKAIIIDSETNEVLNVWGPRPTFIQDKVLKWKHNSEGLSWKDMESTILRSYHEDQGKNIIEEFVGILNSISIMRF